jgi:hypothetical protein
MGPEHKRFQGIANDLVKKNHRLGNGEFGFYFMGKRYTTHHADFLVGMTLPNIHPELIEDVRFLIADIEKAERDTKKLSQSLSVVLPKCSTNQEVRDTLPEVFIRDVPVLRSLERKHPEGFILEKFPMLKRQYDKAVEIAEYYMASKLVY